MKKKKKKSKVISEDAVLFAPEHIDCDKLTNLNDLRTDMPPTLAKKSSIKLKVTMIPSKIFHPF